MKVLVLSNEGKNSHLSSNMLSEVIKKHSSKLQIHRFDVTELLAQDNMLFNKSASPSTLFQTPDQLLIDNKNQRLNELQSFIKTFKPKKIYFCTHGQMNCVQFCYHSNFGEGMSQSVAVGKLAIFLNYLIPKNQHAQLELVMCYGARTSNYLVNHVTHYKELNPLDSFAYRLFARLTKYGTTCSMQAHFNAVKFRGLDIRSSSEKALHLELRKSEILNQRNEVDQKLLDFPISAEDTPEFQLLEKRSEQLFDEYRKICDEILDESSMQNYGAVTYCTVPNTDGKVSIKLNHQADVKTMYHGEMLLSEREIMQAQCLDTQPEQDTHPVNRPNNQCPCIII